MQNASRVFSRVATIDPLRLKAKSTKYILLTGKGKDFLNSQPRIFLTLYQDAARIFDLGDLLLLLSQKYAFDKLRVTS